MNCYLGGVEFRPVIHTIKDSSSKRLKITGVRQKYECYFCNTFLTLKLAFC